MAAGAIAAMDLGRLDERTTANVGSIRGGRATNVVTARCDVTGECRSLERDRVESVRAAMDEAMRSSAARFGGRVEIAWHLEYEGFESAQDSREIELVSAAIRDAGREPSTYRTGGGSDANVFAAMGVPTLALACGMTGVHGTNEEISVDDLSVLARICEAAVRRMAKRDNA